MADELKVVETPEASPVQGAGFSDAMSGIDLDWGEDGEIHFRETGIPSPEEKETAPVETAGEEGVEAKPETKEEPPKISPEIQAILDQNKELLAKLAERDKPLEEQPADNIAPVYSVADDLPEGKDVIDMLTGSREEAAKWLDDVIDKKATIKAEAAMKPVKDAVSPIVVNWNITQQIKELAEDKEHGEDFKNRVPLIAKLSLKRPDLTVRELYDSVKDLPLTTPTPAKTDQVEARREELKTSAVSPQVEAQAIADKAAKLRTEKGIAGGKKAPSQFSTLTEALDAAVEEHSSL